MFNHHSMITTIFLWFGLFFDQVVVKFNMPSTCNVSHLIVDLVTHIGLEAEQLGGGSEVLVRAWDRLGKKVYFMRNVLCNYLLPFMASTNHKQNFSFNLHASSCGFICSMYTGFQLLIIHISRPSVYSYIKEWIKSPQVGFEPTTSQLTADHSTTELLRNKGRFDLLEFNSHSQPVNNMSPKLLS